MNMEAIVRSIFDNLEQVSRANPNERLPKEEQIRSQMYSTLLASDRIVCCERSYTPVGQDTEVECDLYIHQHGAPATWIEIKRCWSGSFGWVTKPAEQLRTWNKDINKLRTVSINDIRHFFIFGVFDFEPIEFNANKIPGVIQNIRSFHPDNLVYKSSREFRWRDENISHIGAWAWSWPCGKVIEIPEQA